MRALWILLCSWMFLDFSSQHAFILWLIFSLVFSIFSGFYFGTHALGDENLWSRSSLPAYIMDAPASGHCSSGLFWTISCRERSEKKLSLLLVFPDCTRGSHAWPHEALHLPPPPSSSPIFSPNSPPLSCLPVTMHAKLDVEAKIVEPGMNVGREGYTNGGAPNGTRQ